MEKEITKHGLAGQPKALFQGGNRIFLSFIPFMQMATESLKREISGDESHAKCIGRCRDTG